MTTGWVRLHTLPKKCYPYSRLLWTPKQSYYAHRSHERYLQTEDGKFISNAIRNMKPEIGRFEGVRFIDSIPFITPIN